MRESLLFLCTGNYYRSRFAELWFNHRAREAGLAWWADSAGLAEQCAGYNSGPISTHTRLALKSRGVALSEPVRAPVDVTAEHFQQATRVVALDRREHEAMVRARFAPFAARVHYWDCADIPLVTPAQCLPLIAGLVDALVLELTASNPGSNQS